MLSQLTVIVTLQYIHQISMLYILIKLIQCFMSIVSQQNWENISPPRNSNTIRGLFYVYIKVEDERQTDGKNFMINYQSYFN